MAIVNANYQFMMADVGANGLISDIDRWSLVLYNILGKKLHKNYITCNSNIN